MQEGIWNVASLSEYHADRSCESHSTLECFRESASLYHAVYISKTVSRDQSEAMKLGTALHAKVFEADRYDDLVAVAPSSDGRTKQGKADRLIFSDKAKGKLVISCDQSELVDAMVAALRASTIAGPLLFDAPGRNEIAIRWQDDSGVWLKCSFDRLLDCGIDINLKTSSNPAPGPWARDAFNFGYHRQSELYRRGKRKFFGGDETLHVVVGNKPPHQVAVYELGTSELAMAANENSFDLEELAKHREFNLWTDPWQRDITTITFPSYAFRR